MIYFFANILMNFFSLLLLAWYFRGQLNIISFIIILFNLNTAFFFVFLKYNGIYQLFLTFFSIIIYQFLLLLNKTSKDIILVQKGNIKFNEVINYYDYHKLIHYLKIRHISLNEIEYCLLHHHHLSIIKSKIDYPVSLIIDGKIQEENLKFVFKDKEWLKKELEREKLQLSMISYAFYQKKKIYFVRE